MNPLLALLVGQAINMAGKAFYKGDLALPDAVPIITSLVDALGHVTNETPEERAARRAQTEEMFARHNTPLVGPQE